MSSVLGLTPGDLETMPNVLVGSVDEIVAQLQRRRDLFGLSYVSVGAASAE